MTSHRRAPKQKLSAGYRMPSKSTSYSYLWAGLFCEPVLFLIIECGIAQFRCTVHAMWVLDVWASSSPPAYPWPNFVSVTSFVVELASGEKLHTQSITHSVTHSPSLFDMLGTEAFPSEQ